MTITRSKQDLIIIDEVEPIVPTEIMAECVRKAFNHEYSFTQRLIRKYANQIPDYQKFNKKVVISTAHKSQDKTIHQLLGYK